MNTNISTEITKEYLLAQMTALSNDLKGVAMLMGGLCNDENKCAVTLVTSIIEDIGASMEASVGGEFFFIGSEIEMDKGE